MSSTEEGASAAGVKRGRKKRISATPASASGVTGSTFGALAARVTGERETGLDEQAVALSLAISSTANLHMQESERRVHRPHGWSWSAFHIMYIVWLFGDVEARDIARLSGVSRQSTSTVLANLEGSGLIKREQVSPTDRRLISVTLTPTGTEAVEAAFAEQNSLEAKWFGCLDADERLQLKSMLDRISDQIRASKHESV